MRKIALTLAVILGITLSAHLAFAEETGSGATGTAGTDSAAASGVTAPETIKKNLELQNEAAKKALEQRKKEVENKKGALEERQKEMTAKKEELNKKAMERSREQAKQLLERLKKQLENLRERIKSAKELSETDVNAIVAKIDAEIGKIEALKEKIGQAQTREEVKALGQEIKNKTKILRKYSLTFHSRLMVVKMNKIVGKISDKIITMEAKIGELKATGRDVAGLETIITDAKSHIAEAKKYHDEAKAKFLSGLDAENPEAIVKEAANLAKEANKHVILAHKSLQSLIPAINRLIRPKDGATTPPVVIPPAATTSATQ